MARCDAPAFKASWTRSAVSARSTCGNCSGPGTQVRYPAAPAAGYRKHDITQRNDIERHVRATSKPEGSLLRRDTVRGALEKATGLGLGPSPANYQSNLRQIDIGARLTGRYHLLGREHELILGASFARQALDFYGFAPDYSKLPPIGNFFQWTAPIPSRHGAASAHTTSSGARNNGAISARRGYR